MAAGTTMTPLLSNVNSPPREATVRANTQTDGSDLWARLRQRAAAALREFIPPSRRCALVDFPMHGNVGDSAIWLGERTLLRDAGVTVAYACDLQSFSVAELAERVPAGTGTIFVHGGGNLGDLWPHHQVLRERVISAFPNHRIVQLPQSVHFRDPANLARARAVFDAHAELTLLVRDYRSLEVTRREFRARSMLCPDLALGLDRVPASSSPRHRVVWLSRTDHERATHVLPAPPPGIHRTDWNAGEGATPDWQERLRQTLNAQRAAALRNRMCPSDHATHLLCQSLDHHAELQLWRGCRLLSSGRAVVTDRLHAHVLSLLLGIQHAVLDDRHGKVRSFWETWTSDAKCARLSRTTEEALSYAEWVATEAHGVVSRLRPALEEGTVGSQRRACR
jgi:exopolysaccharide biosynthesis predicted pyruvyltransferase EpsI